MYTRKMYAKTQRKTHVLRCDRNGNQNLVAWRRACEAQQFIVDHVGLAAVDEMVQGLIDADLGGGIVKKRIGLAGRGKRGGARTLVATNKRNRWFFVYGFEKNNRTNISDDELEALQDIAKQLLTISGHALDIAVQDGSLQEI